MQQDDFNNELIVFEQLRHKAKNEIIIRTNKVDRGLGKNTFKQ